MIEIVSLQPPLSLHDFGNVLSGTSGWLINDENV
jgi:hypothetical protein